MAYSYDKDIDYQALINEAVGKKDFQSAAVLEQQRNAKGQGEGIAGFVQTNNYTGNLDTTDYSTMLKQQMEGNAPVADVADTIAKRTGKASSAVNLTGYANDDIYMQAMDYIKNGAGKMRFEAAPSYVSQNQGKIDALLNEVLNGSFTDFQASPEFASLEGQFVNRGQRAMRDTVGDVSARTGGLASSYAQTAGQQAYGNFMTQLNDAAMSMYQGQRSDNLNNLNALMGVEAQDYGKYQDQLGQYNTDRNVDYQFDKDNRSELEDRAKTMAAIGDFSLLKELGYTDAEIAALTAAWQMEQAGKGSGGSGGGRDKTPPTSNRPNYGNENVNLVNVARDNGYTSDEIIAGAKSDLKYGRITQQKYNSIVDAALRRR